MSPQHRFRIKKKNFKFFPARNIKMRTALKCYYYDDGKNMFSISQYPITQELFHCTTNKKKWRYFITISVTIFFFIKKFDLCVFVVCWCMYVCVCDIKDMMLKNSYMNFETIMKYIFLCRVLFQINCFMICACSTFNLRRFEIFIPDVVCVHNIGTCTVGCHHVLDSQYNTQSKKKKATMLQV